MVRVFVDHVTKIFGDKEKKVLAVDDLTLEIPDGAFVGILGPSGCGKTTTLRIIAGLETPTKGKVYFDEEDVTEWDTKKRNVAMVFQFPVLYPSITIYDNLAITLRSNKISRPIVREEVKRVAELLGISQYLNMKPPELDINIRQKVCLAKALLRDPTIFIFDEPLTVVDPKVRVELRTKIKEIQLKLKKPMLYVTHDQAEVLTLAEKIAIMNEGKLLQYDTPENCYINPANTFVGYFIGNPGMNFIECDISSEDGKLYLITDGGFKYDITPLANLLEKFDPLRKVILGIRPEFVQVGVKGMKAKCTYIEPMGNITIVHLEVYDRRLRVKIPMRYNIKAGDEIWINLPMEKIRLFHYHSGKLLL
ncbi:MAG: ABC transporter ATP-binding protein [Nitrososphaerota archaeon]